MLLMETRATDEASDEGCRWNLSVRYRTEIVDELRKSMYLGILRTILRYASEYRFCVISEDSELHEIRRVKHHICHLLVRKYPLFFGLAHIRPLADGLTGCECALVIITDDTSKKTIVAGRNPVVIIKSRARKR